MRQYKANLTIVNGRYGDLERRVLEIFAKNPNFRSITIPGGHGLHLMYLLEDGLLIEVPVNGGSIRVAGVPALQGYEITDKGLEFVDRWINASRLG